MHFTEPSIHKYTYKYTYIKYLTEKNLTFFWSTCSCVWLYMYMHGEQHAHAGLCGGQRSSLDVVPQKLSTFFPFLFFHFSYVCMEHVCMNTSIHKKVQSDVRIYAQLLFYLIHRGRVLVKPDFLIWLVLLASLLGGSCFCLDRLELQAGWHVHPAFPVGFWGLTLHVKHFNC